MDQLSSARGQKEGQANSPTIPFTSSLPLSESMSRYDKSLMDTIICDICGSADFNNDSELSAHKKLHHVKSKIGPVSLQCAYCNEHCKSRSDLENHMKNHQINSNKGKHKCNICDEIYSSAITLAEHKLSHCKIVSGNTCTQCKTILSDEQSFYSHQLKHSSVLSKSNAQISLPANCIICCQTLQTDVEIKLHANFHLQHLLHKEYLCNICNKIFDTRTGITIPSYEKNSEGLQISVCKECINKCGNNSSSNSPRLTNIKNENLDKKIYSCIKCPQTFETESEVKKHAATHISDGINHECHICRSIFSTPLKLQLHVIEHSFFGTGQFRCYICSSVFTTANGLLSHMLEHGANAKPYECATCQMKFFFQTELDNHKYEHIISQAVAQSINVNSVDDSEVLNSEKLKMEHLGKCPYCDMTTSHVYLDVHIRFCLQNPDIKKRHENKRNAKFAESTNSVSESEDKAL